MDDKRKDVYGKGVTCLLASLILGWLAINNEWNTAGQILWGLTIFFGGLGTGSILKPDSFGTVAFQFLDSIFGNRERKKSDSDNKQIQSESSGVQVMATSGAKVNINVPSGKKENTQDSVSEKEFLRKETILVSPDTGYSYAFNLTRGDHLEGDISSDGRIDIYFVDDENYGKWEKNNIFDYEDCNENVLETQIEYEAPRNGFWYLLIDNNGRKPAEVKVLLY